MRIICLTCNGTSNPLGIESLTPVFGWQMESRINGKSQTAYQIKVAKTKAKLVSNSSLLWDSGKVDSNQSLHIRYNGLKLRPATYYYWQVRVWCESDEPGEWSEIAFWQMGLLSEADWGEAKWIGLEKQPKKDRLVPGLFFKFLPENFDRKVAANKLPQFRKQIGIEKAIDKAIIFIAGLGHYELLLNGNKVSHNFLKAGWTNYEKTIFYNTYDITQQLQQGDNVIGVLLGNGMYNVPNERYFMLLTSFGYPQLIAKISITYKDGTKQVISTDESWKVTQSPITYSSIFGGEDYDANLIKEGWVTPYYDDSHWHNALIIGNPTEQLRPEIQPALQVAQAFDAISVKEIDPDTWVYDFGQNFSGIPSIEIEASNENQKIKITPAELVDEKDNITTQNMWGDHHYNYTTKGEPNEKWQPRFTFYGFRYLQLKGAVPKGSPNPKRLPVVGNLKGLFITSKASKVGSFSAGNVLINDIYRLVKWAMRSNFASVMMDCPHREKLGWLEQAHLMAPSYHFEFNSYSFFKKIVNDMCEAQTFEGLVPCIAPEYTQFSPQYRESPEWGGALIMLSWATYKFYGDLQLLERTYPKMEKYFSYLQNRSSSYLLAIGIGDWMDLGENEPGPSQLTPTHLVDSALYYQCATTMCQVAKALGKSKDEKSFRLLSKEIKDAFNAKYFNAQEATYATGSQTALSMPLYLGLVPDQSKKEVLITLKRILKETNYQLTSGDIGHRYLLKTLEQNGLNEYIFNIHTNATQPSYAYQIAQGATALTESWQASRKASHNHCMLGHIMEWFYTGLAGIGQTTDSIRFKHIIIKPHILPAVGRIDVSFKSPYGLIGVSWQYTKDKTDLTVIIPANTIASIYLPVTNVKNVLLNDAALTKDSAQLINNRVVVEVTNGKYHFKLLLSD